MPGQGEQGFPGAWEQALALLIPLPELFPGSSPAEPQLPRQLLREVPLTFLHLKDNPFQCLSDLSSLTALSTPEMLIRSFAGLFSASVSGM